MQHSRNDGLALDFVQAGPITTMTARRWGGYIVFLFVSVAHLISSTTATTALARGLMKEKMDFSPQFLRLRILSDDRYKMSYLALL
jgi:multisubunit Na+/H+ antiporter MnhE subunit